MTNVFSKKITLGSLLKLTLPTVIMMVFFSSYTIIDGIFISSFVGSNGLSATNIVFPVISLLLAVGVMFATGGSAIVAKNMGEGKNQEARSKFTLLTITALITATIIGVLSITFIKNLIFLLGATEALYDNCHRYLFTMLAFTPCIILKVYFDYFLVTAGAARLSLVSSVAGGIINIVLDYLFMAKLHMGIEGAAIATCIGYAVPSLVGIMYFMNKKHNLHFVSPSKDIKVILEAAGNGSSEMVIQLSSAVTTFVYNLVMMNLIGEDGVAAITIILYVQFLLASIYSGYTSGASPCISFNYGGKNRKQLEKIIRYSFLIVCYCSLISFGISLISGDFLIRAFAGSNKDVFQIARNGFSLYSLGFLIGGFNIFITGMFTAFSNGKVSAFLSLMRTLVLFLIGITILPYFMGINGVWLVVPFAEAVTLIIGIYFVYSYRKEYLYG